jgi:hypothetical protein
MTASRHFIAGLIVAVVVFVCGCGPSRPDPKALIAAVNDVNGKRLANLYAIYQSRYLGYGPRDRAAFEKFITQEMTPVELDGTGVDQKLLDTLFVSERDGQPFFIRYGVQSTEPSSPAVNLAVIFESQGVNGSVAVYMTGPKMVVVPQAEVEDYRAGKRDRLPAAAGP